MILNICLIGLCIMFILGIVYNYHLIKGNNERFFEDMDKSINEILNAQNETIDNIRKESDKEYLQKQLENKLDKEKKLKEVDEWQAKKLQDLIKKKIEKR